MKNMKNKMIMVGLVAMMGLSMAGCGNGTKNSSVVTKKEKTESTVNNKKDEEKSALTITTQWNEDENVAGQIEGDLELEVDGVKFHVGDKLSDVLPKVEALGHKTGVRPDGRDNYQAIYYYQNEKDWNGVTYTISTDENGDEVLGSIIYIVPMEAYRRGDHFSFFKVNGYSLDKMIDMLEGAGCTTFKESGANKEFSGSFQMDGNVSVHMHVSTDSSKEMNIYITKRFN